MTSSSTYIARLERARAEMTLRGVDVLLLSVGADLPYFTGYTAMPLERLTMLVVPRDGDAILVVPRLEAPRVVEQGSAFTLRSWEELEDPIAIVAAHMRGAAVAAVGDHTWARFVIDLQRATPDTRFVRANDVTAPLRRRKDADELALLRAAGRAVDACIDDLRGLSFAGRREIDVHRDIARLLVEHGHQRMDFAIVAAGENAASPHHEPGDRVIQVGETVLCDFGGTRDGYCSDITRVFSVGGPATDEVADAWAALCLAQEIGVQTGAVGVPCEAVDTATRASLTDAGYGEYFVHRTGHGIGTETHEDPYIVAGNGLPLEVGNAYSVEPGIYIPGRFGLRLEDIVLITETGPERVSHAPRELMVVE
ncbi:MAG: M24 family metallopeptidase [Acidimicrobiia bacterium]